jgi:hypothetical protein
MPGALIARFAELSHWQRDDYVADRRAACSTDHFRATELCRSFRT